MPQLNETAQPLLLISRHARGFSRSERQPLFRVVLPWKAASVYGRPPKAHVWWIERAGQLFHIKAKFYVEAVTLEKELKSGQQRTVWHLSTLHSERIAWTGTQRRELNVTELLAGLPGVTSDGIALIPAPVALDGALETRRVSVAESVLKFEQAVPRLRRLFARTKNQISSPIPADLSFRQAYSHVRMWYAREELIRITDCDVYELAAAVLIGLSSVPDKDDQAFEEPAASTAINFAAIDEQQLDSAERNWKEHSEGFFHLDKLEAKTKRHQQMLKALARVVRSKGFCPTYNLHVDLRAECRGHDVLFELKTADSHNFHKQVRRAVGQLLEYRYRYRGLNGDKSLKLAAVIEGGVSAEQHEFARGFLHDVGIVMVLWKPDTSQFYGLNEVLF